MTERLRRKEHRRCVLFLFPTGPESTSMDGGFLAASLRTVALMAVAVAIALPCGALWGVALVRSCRAVALAGLATAVIAAALPLYLHAAAWEAAFGKFGWLGQVAGRSWALGGFAATAWVHGLAGTAWVALASVWAWRRVPAEILDAAELDAGPMRALVRVGFPAVAPAAFAASAWVAVVAATEFTVADLYGVRTLADELYVAQARGVDRGQVVAACVVPWIAVAVLAAALWRRVPRGGWMSPSSAARSAPGWAAPVVTVAGGVLVVGVPLASLIVKAGWISSWDGEVATARFSAAAAAETLVRSWGGFAEELRGSAVLAAATGAVAVSLAWGVWSLVAAGRPRQGVVAVMIFAALVPAPVVALAIVRAFDRSWPPGLAALYDRTLIPTVLAILPRAVPAAFLVVAAGGVAMCRGWREAAQLDGAGAVRRWWAIDRVVMAPAAGAALAVAVLVALSDLTASLLVLPPGVTTVSARMFGLLHSGVRRQEAGLGLVTAIVVAMIAAAVVVWAGRRHTRGRGG